MRLFPTVAKLILADTGWTDLQGRWQRYGDLKQQRTPFGVPANSSNQTMRRRENFVTAGTRRRRCGNTILTDKAEDGGRRRLPRGGTHRAV